MKITTIVPAYNASSFLSRCLSSVSSQTVQPDEVLVVDDGSTDNTASLASKLGARVLQQANLGLSAARNAGLKRATGDWIAFLDADDWWAPEKLERQLGVISSDTVLVYTGIRCVGDRGELSSVPAMDPVSALKTLRFRNPITPSTVLVRRSAALQIGGFNEELRACEDWDMWVRLKPIGSFACVPDLLTYYYIHPSSLSADPERMLGALAQILDSTLLAGCNAWARPLWRRRILASQLLSAGLIARDNRLGSELHYLLRSLLTWPSPLWQPQRFAALAVTLRDRVRNHAHIS